MALYRHGGAPMGTARWQFPVVGWCFIDPRRITFVHDLLFRQLCR
jgi:hypothetical protein